ncbi:MAG TPA: hypothetical protein VN661_04125 [Candidatus Acidoferrales bacterium]|nr:hypothetical protein [Candidatus Acidoferrales bacterium]
MEIDNQQALVEIRERDEQKSPECRYARHRSVLLASSREIASYRHCTALDDARIRPPEMANGELLPVRTHLSYDQSR